MTKSHIQATFVPCDRQDMDSTHTDLCHSREGQALAIHLLKKYWDVDFSKCELSGIYCRTGQSFGVWFDDPSDPLSCYHDHMEILGVHPGSVTVRTKIGCSMSDVIRQEMLAPLKAAWLTINGYEPDFPTSCEVEVNGDTIEIKLSPFI